MQTEPFAFYQPRRLRVAEKLVLLPQFGSPSGGTHRPMNSWALLFGDRCVLFDAVLQNAVPGIRGLIAEGVEPVACVLSHADLCAAGDAFDAFTGELGVPLLLHPEDQADPRAQKLGVAWEEPAGFLAGTGLPVEALHWPGHSPGLVMLYTPEAGGVLLTGDAAVAPGPMQPDDQPALVRPPAGAGATDDEVVAAWRAFDRTPLSTIAPLHGRALLNISDPSEPIGMLADGPAMTPRVRERA